MTNLAMMIENNPPNIELRSEEIQEIVSYVPHWIVRWGITVFFLVLMLLLTASWIIHYPDLVKAPFRLTSLNAPKSVNSKIDGKLIKLLVQNKSLVQQGQILAYLESTADHKEILTLSAQLDTVFQLLSRNDPGVFTRRSLMLYSHLGELQADYQAFDLAYTQFLAYQSDGFYSTKRKILDKELSDLIGLERNLQEQLKINQHDWQIAREEFAVQKNLAEQKVISSADLRREESKLLLKQLPLKETKSALYQNYSTQDAKRKELLELDKVSGEQRGLFTQALNTLRSAVEGWKNRYVLSAPVDGRVYFSTTLEEKQTLAANQEVFFIGPETGNYFGEALIPQQNLGKVRKGQQVIIRFAGYPFQEFGVVTGRIEYISEVPSKENTFFAKVTLPNGLQTNYGKPITYRTGMNATAEIITSDSRLLEKIFYNFRKAIARSG